MCGDKWAEAIARVAAQAGLRPTYEKRSKPLDVSGVGNDSNVCLYGCTLPVAFGAPEGREAVAGILKTPAVKGSDLPGLLGLSALRERRAVLDFSTLRLHFCGPGEI